ncbi:MAG: lysozyme [Burkholderiales bacterium]|nr:lysozyme [Burkholderiales bacterium]
MQTGKNGIALIQKFEGLRLTSYQDSVGIWTIGDGHTGADVKPGMTINPSQVLILLQQDLERFESGVNKSVKVPLTQNQFDALISFSYNVGLGNFSKSTLLKRLNEANYSGAADQFPRWNKAGGQILKGLVDRRNAEAALFRESEA